MRSSSRPPVDSGQTRGGSGTAAMRLLYLLRTTAASMLSYLTNAIAILICGVGGAASRVDRGRRVGLDRRRRRPTSPRSSAWLRRRCCGSSACTSAARSDVAGSRGHRADGGRLDRPRVPELRTWGRPHVTGRRVLPVGAAADCGWHQLTIAGAHPCCGAAVAKSSPWAVRATMYTAAASSTLNTTPIASPPARVDRVHAIRACRSHRPPCLRLFASPRSPGSRIAPAGLPSPGTLSLKACSATGTCGEGGVRRTIVAELWQLKCAAPSGLPRCLFEPP